MAEIVAIMKFEYDDLLRFREKINIGTECWDWTAGLNNKGYGIFCFNKSRMYAHRFSYLVFNGPLLNLNVCHECDRPICCNPKHLWLGTQLDNIRDARMKGRMKDPPKPFNHKYTAKLTKQEVVEIRYLFDIMPNLTNREVASSYNMTEEPIRQIRRNISWLK